MHFDGTLECWKKSLIRGKLTLEFLQNEHFLFGWQCFRFYFKTFKSAQVSETI